MKANRILFQKLCMFAPFRPRTFLPQRSGNHLNLLSFGIHKGLLNPMDCRVSCNCSWSNYGGYSPSFLNVTRNMSNEKDIMEAANNSNPSIHTQEIIDEIRDFFSMVDNHKIIEHLNQLMASHFMERQTDNVQCPAYTADMVYHTTQAITFLAKLEAINNKVKIPTQ